MAGGAEKGANDPPFPHTIITTMTTEQYNLRNGAIVFTVEHPDAADIRKALADLPDGHLVALADSALANWAYRAAAKEGNDGKSFSFSEAVADMATTGTRSSGPSKADQKAAEAWFAQTLLGIEKVHPLTDSMEPDARKAAIAARRANWIATLKEKIRANNAKFPGLAFPEDVAEDVKSTCASLIQAVRLHVARMSKAV